MSIMSYNNKTYLSFDLRIRHLRLKVILKVDMATIFDKLMIIVHNHLGKLDIATIFYKFMIIVPNTIYNIYILSIFFMI